jgi:hypothetical protein
MKPSYTGRLCYPSLDSPASLSCTMRYDPLLIEDEKEEDS